MQAEDLISHRSLDQLENDLVTRAAHINAQEYRFLCDVREFDIRQGWKAYHFNHCAEWLSWRCQLSLGAAREKVRVAQCLAGLPLVAEAFGQGIIAYSKVKALSRIAGPDNEQALVEYAREHTTEQVERHCQALRHARPELSTDDANRVYRSRYLFRSRHDDGSMTINVQLPREMGELVMQAIEIAMNHDVTQDHDLNAETDAYFARQADALVRVARDYLADDSDIDHGKQTGSGDNYTVMVHVDEAALAGRGGESDLPIETVRRITCDSSLVTVVKDAQGQPLDVGRKQRVVPTKIRRAVLARDRHCRFPGCSHTHYLEPHHVIHWADGGETKVEELVALCSRHHRLHHEGGYSVHKLSDGQFVFRHADGRLIPDAPPYRGTDHEDIDDATLAAYIEQSAARHVPRGVCEEKSRYSSGMAQDSSYIPRGMCEEHLCESADVMQDNSYVPRGACEGKSRDSSGIVQGDSYTSSGRHNTANNRVEERAPPAW